MAAGCARRISHERGPVRGTAHLKARLDFSRWRRRAPPTHSASSCTGTRLPKAALHGGWLRTANQPSARPGERHGPPESPARFQPLAPPRATDAFSLLLHRYAAAEGCAAWRLAAQGLAAIGEAR